MKEDINVQQGLGEVGERMHLLNTQQYLLMRREAIENDGQTPSNMVDYDLTLWDTTKFTDWQKVLIGGKSEYFNIQNSISGGTPSVQYLIGTGYHKETTVFPGDANEQKGSAHFNLNSISNNKKLKINFSGVYTIDNNHSFGIDLTQMAIQLPPNAPSVYNADGTLNWAPNITGASTWPGRNPAANLLSKYNIHTQNLISNSVISYVLFPGIEVRTSLGYNTIHSSTFLAIFRNSETAKFD